MEQGTHCTVVIKLEKSAPFFCIWSKGVVGVKFIPKPLSFLLGLHTHSVTFGYFGQSEIKLCVWKIFFKEHQVPF